VSDGALGGAFAHADDAHMHRPKNPDTLSADDHVYTDQQVCSIWAKVGLRHALWLRHSRRAVARKPAAGCSVERDDRRERGSASNTADCVIKAAQ
jgi:hypothetical protein